MARSSSNNERRLFALLAASIVSQITATAYASEGSYIFEIPAERSAVSVEPLGDYIFATLEFADPQRAATGIEASGALDIVEIADSDVVVGIAHDAVTTAVVTESDLAASFVIDFDEDAVSSTAKLLRDAYGEQPTPEEIENFVFEYILTKSYLGSFDFASKVAQTRSGDCTEHAVLVVALARQHGIPARLVMGVVLLLSDEAVGAYGHAWTEVYLEDSWRRLDATSPASLGAADKTYYLPLMTLDDEGPGFGMDIMRLTIVQPARISDIQAGQRPKLSQ